VVSKSWGKGGKGKREKGKGKRKINIDGYLRVSF
jgi:hypothetical protein